MMDFLYSKKQPFHNMTITERLQQAVDELDKLKITYALAGGFAASLYRAEPRLTADVDFVIATKGNVAVKAEEILTSLGLTPSRIRQADFDGGPLFAIKKKSTPVVMLAGREKGNRFSVGVDLLTEEIPWVRSALERAKHHKIDVGFGPIPVLPVEDVILSKLYALSKSVNRPKDLDDLLSIAEAEVDLDRKYIRAHVTEIGIKLKKQTKELLPDDFQGLI